MFNRPQSMVCFHACYRCIHWGRAMLTLTTGLLWTVRSDSTTTVHVASVRADAGTDMCSALFDTERMFRHRRAATGGRRGHTEDSAGPGSDNGNARAPCGCSTREENTAVRGGNVDVGVSTTQTDTDWISTWVHVPHFPICALAHTCMPSDPPISGHPSGGAVAAGTSLRENFGIGVIYGSSGRGKSMIRAHYFGPNVLETVKWIPDVPVVE